MPKLQAYIPLDPQATTVVCVFRHGCFFVVLCSLYLYVLCLLYLSCSVYLIYGLVPEIKLLQKCSNSEADFRKWVSRLEGRSLALMEYLGKQTSLPHWNSKSTSKPYIRTPATTLAAVTDQTQNPSSKAVYDSLVASLDIFRCSPQFSCGQQQACQSQKAAACSSRPVSLSELCWQDADAVTW